MKKLLLKIFVISCCTGFFEINAAAQDNNERRREIVQILHNLEFWSFRLMIERDNKRLSYEARLHGRAYAAEGSFMRNIAQLRTRGYTALEIVQVYRERDLEIHTATSCQKWFSCCCLCR